MDSRFSSMDGHRYGPRQVAGGIESFPVLPGIEAVTIFADADGVGIKAAQACSKRWLEAGCEAVIVPPPESQRLADHEEAFLNSREASK